MIVLRDTITGACHLSKFTPEELDTDRLAEGNLEIAGHVADEDEPMFTTCEHDGCKKWILIIDEMAPDRCAEHYEN